MTLNQLQYFQTICKYMSFTKAAEVLHISQPSLSNAIKKLEADFGCLLFYRVRNRIELTEAGKFLLGEANRILKDAEDLVNQMNSFAIKKEQLKIGVPYVVGSILYPSFFDKFHKQYPNIALKMYEYGSISITNKILDGSLDVAIVSCIRYPSNLNYIELGQVDICFYISKDNPIANKKTIDFQSIKNTPLILFSNDSFITDFVLKNFHRINESPQIIANSNQLITIYDLLKKNIGATFLFNKALKADEDIAKIPITNSPLIKICLIWNKGGKVSSVLNSLIKFSRDQYNGIE